MPQTAETLKAGGGPAQTEILIIGAGLAGLFLALKLAPRACTIVTPAPLGQAASSAWAQGGLAAALDPEDSPEEHAADTVSAGAGLVDPAIALLIASEGPARIRDLLELGVPFDRTPEGALALSLEAAHSRPRVARVAGDLAGRAIMDALTGAVAAAASHIRIVEGLKAVSLLQTGAGRIAGIVTEDRGGRRDTLTAQETVLCTGGLGGLYRVTTNPPGARGDAIAMAAACGALVADPEFVQFHPTAMDFGLDPAPLATEALRGEGARLVNRDGNPFMTRYHSDGELAPRDEVARAIHAERLAGRGAFLDARAAVGDAFPEHFPTVFAAARAAGIDPRKAAVPVSPAAHYHMGGLVSDDWGRTTLEGLSACGECASTGAHGANRLASNSLLEAVVFAERIARRLKTEPGTAPDASAGRVWPSLAPATLSELRTRMQADCGVVRDRAGLSSLIDWISGQIAMAGIARPLSVAAMVARASLAREESRGGHFRSDFTGRDGAARSFVTLEPDGEIRTWQEPAA